MTAADETNKTENTTRDASPSTSEEPSELEQKVITQLEFYFGDHNLPRDKFMLEQVKLDNGWIPMSTMLKFQRLSRLTTDEKVITCAIKHSQLLEVDTEGTEPKLRRSPSMPLPEFNEERRKDVLSRSLYFKGFPLDSTFDDVDAVINPAGPTQCILMRKYKDKVTQKYLFKGSIFATYKDQEAAQAVLDGPPIKVGETELIRMWQNKYIEQKKKEAEESRGKKDKKEPKKEVKETSYIDSGKLKKNATFHLKGIKGETSRENIRDTLTNLGVETVYVGFQRGDEEAYVRLAEENSAPAAVEKLGEDLTIDDAKITVRILEGEEEDTYLKKAEEDMRAHLQRAEQGRRFKRGNRKRHFNKSGRGRNDDGAPPSKKVAAAE